MSKTMYDALFGAPELATETILGIMGTCDMDDAMDANCPSCPLYHAPRCDTRPGLAAFLASPAPSDPERTSS